MLEKNTVLKQLETKLLSFGITNAKQELRFLITELLGKSKSEIITQDYFTKQELKILKKAVKKRCKHVPLQIILGQSEFLNVKILENKHTLTPRPETELLTSIIINEYKNKPVKMLDLCCGSGCIGIALAKNGHTVTGVDLSKKALKCAEKNAKLNGVNVRFLKSDMFSKVDEKFDVIVSNPPYIEHKDIKSLTKEVKKFDPLLALDGGEDGLNFYVSIANNAHKYLTENGVLYLELGYNQANSVKKLLEKHYKNITIIKDYNNIDRFIKAELC